MTMTLRHYVRAAQNGDERAFEFLFTQFEPLFKRHLGQYAYQYENDDEIRSSIYSAAVLCIMEFDLTKPGTVRQAMKACVHNFLEREAYHMEKYRSKVKKNIEGADGCLTDLPECTAPLSQCPEYQFAKNEVKRQVWAALQQLEERKRYFIILHYMHGHSYRKIANKHDVSEKTIRRIVSRGVDCLKAIMKENPISA